MERNEGIEEFIHSFSVIFLRPYERIPQLAITSAEEDLRKYLSAKDALLFQKDIDLNILRNLNKGLGQEVERLKKERETLVKFEIEGRQIPELAKRIQDLTTALKEKELELEAGKSWARQLADKGIALESENARLREALKSLVLANEERESYFRRRVESPTQGPEIAKELWDEAKEALSGKSCEHDKGKHWELEQIGGNTKSYEGVCPFCKPSGRQG